MTSAEERARQQYESVLGTQKQQNLLLSNLEAIRNNMEHTAFENKTKFEARIESLERDLMLEHRKVEMEEQRYQKLADSFKG